MCLFGCSTSSVAPAPSLESILPAGAYWLRAAPLVSPSTLKCSESDRYLGASLQANVHVEYDGGVLVARSTTSADGDLEIRISISGSRFGETLVAGTARGTAIEGTATLRFSKGGDGAASLTGALYTYSGPYLAGNAVGTFLAESILGRETCQYAQWRLEAL
jgi:hypothetical protein